MSIKTIFLDRDGVINKEKHYLYKIEDFEFINGVHEACRYLTELDYKIIIITNQSGISRGLYSEKDYKILTKWMLDQFKSNLIDIHDVYYCPHSSKDHCQCRKPLPGMLIKAQKKYNIDMQNSWLCGDKEVDIIAANSSGITNTILVKSGHKIDEENSQAKYLIDSIKDIGNIIRS